MNNRKLRGGMIGGGIGAFIGPVHRMAAIMDGEAEFVAGCFSSNPEKSRKSGEALYLDPTRVYSDWKEMILAESAQPAESRLDFISIVTPTASHYAIAKMVLEAGFNIICDKPMTLTLKEAKSLRDMVKKSGKIFALTHNYTGYPMVKEARVMVSEEKLGKINKIVVEYPQGWLASLLTGKAADLGIWRMDPKQAGASCCIADIGIHAENLARYITGLEVDSLCADLLGFIPGNKLDDDGSVLLRYKGGAKGILYASQISTGEENGLNIRVYGSKAGICWNQENPNYLFYTPLNGPTQKLSRGNSYNSQIAKDFTRIPFGHPEGFIEAFANLYLEAFKAIRALAGKKKVKVDVPTVEDGIMGLRFIETVLKSHKSSKKWTKLLS